MRTMTFAWILLSAAYFFQSTDATLIFRHYLNTMKCSYGERGSLTATCVNATPSFFKATSYRFDHLDETLQCLQCNLTNLESYSFDITENRIKNLILKNANIENLHQRAFVGLVFLINLNMENNKIRSIYPGTFSGVKKIESVNLRHNSITILSSEGFAELKNLQTLILAENKISTIDSKAFNGLESLTTMDLSNNQITTVNGIFNLTRLQYLDLSYNEINNLNGQEFENLTSLLEIKLSHNKLTKIPAYEFSTLSNLNILDLSKNNISVVDTNAFKGLVRLEKLDLSENNIKDIAANTLESLHSLESVNLSYNSLKEFRTNRFRSPMLSFLNLSHNSINEIITNGIFPLHSLHNLDLSYNNLTQLNYISLLHRIPKIFFLNLKGNNWPCDLEDEMARYFNEENFKFLLFDKSYGKVECSLETSKPKNITAGAAILGRALIADTTVHSDFLIFVILAVMFVSLLGIVFIQFRISKQMRFNPIINKRTTSEVQLISSDLEERNDFLKD